MIKKKHPNRFTISFNPKKPSHVLAITQLTEAGNCKADLIADLLIQNDMVEIKQYIDKALEQQFDKIQKLLQNVSLVENSMTEANDSLPKNNTEQTIFNAISMFRQSKD